MGPGKTDGYCWPEFEGSQSMPEPATSLSLTVDDVAYDVATDPFELLADTLRDRLDVRGVKIGCREGVCGSCNVLIDGDLARSCLMLATQAEGYEITTVAGLGSDAEPHPLQKELVANGAIQCGFCIPGFVTAAAALPADERVAMTREDIAAALSGTLCRCSGYQKMIDAVATVLERGDR